MCVYFVYDKKNKNRASTLYYLLRIEDLGKKQKQNVSTWNVSIREIYSRSIKTIWRKTMIPSCSQPQNCAGGSTRETILKSGICRLVTSENFVMKHRVRLTFETVLQNLRKMMFLSFAFQNPITRQIRWSCSVCAKKMKPKRSAPCLLRHVIFVSTC